VLVFFVTSGDSATFVLGMLSDRGNPDPSLRNKLSWGVLVALIAIALLVGATATVALDALGNIPFMRSVHPYERPQMTTVFRTYIDFSDLLPAAMFSVLLTFFDIRAVFVTAGLWMLAEVFAARRLPRRM